MSGFSERVLKALDISEDQLREVVERAQTDEDVAQYLRRHVDTRKYAAINEQLRALDFENITDPERRERLLNNIRYWVVHPVPKSFLRRSSWTMRKRFR
ncbi:MAG: hypothetical protein M3160_01355 [Candidatus Eremiobacteraeota bacterium]|nr:hypothetical protein [Candidatus Eremiobacteraeota bacterium]